MNLGKSCLAMCSLSVSQPGSNFSIGPLPFSSFPVFSVEDELESSASAADAAGEADAAWGDAAWGDAAGAAEPSSSSSEDAASLLDAPASALAPLLPDDASSDAGLLDASALTGGESETASGEGGALPDASASGEGVGSDDSSSDDDPRPGIGLGGPRRIAALFQSRSQQPQPRPHPNGEHTSAENKASRKDCARTYV